jgi:hypothetical protein
LREWSHDKTKQVFPRGARAGSSAGIGPAGRVRLGVGDDALDRDKDRLYGSGTLHDRTPDAAEGTSGRHTGPMLQGDHDWDRNGIKVNRPGGAQFHRPATQPVMGGRFYVCGDLALDALEQALYARPESDQLVHHSDRGIQYVSIHYTERLKDHGIELSVGSVGDAYDNALAETIIGLFKTEVIHKRGPWRHLEQVEFATLEWVDWFNTRRLLEPIGCIPPAEFEQLHYQRQHTPAIVAGLT